MRFHASVVAAVAFASLTSNAFQPAVKTAQRTALLMSTLKEQETKPTKKEERLRMMKSDKFFRQGFKEVREQVEDTMGQQFKSEIVDDLKSSNYVMERDGVKVYLAKVSACNLYNRIIE